MRRWPISTTTRDLATEWVLAEHRGDPNRFEDQREIQEEIYRRAGYEHGDRFLDQAEEAFRILNPPDELKWPDGLSVKL